MELIKEIALLRRRCGATQKQLADAAGISYSYLTKLESGAAKNPTIGTIAALLAALDELDCNYNLRSTGDIRTALRVEEATDETRSDPRRD